MSNNSRLGSVAALRRKVCAALPAVALIGGGVAVTAQADLAGDLKSASVSNGSSAIVVPDIVRSLPEERTRLTADPFEMDSPGGRVRTRRRDAVAGTSARALALPAGTAPGSSTPVVLDGHGVPVRALQAYRAAALLVDSADPGCHIDWALIGAIGRVESDHARFGGNQLDSAGVAQPGIIGIPLDGSNGTALITDSDGGLLDGDTDYDRAVGPMQFIPSTWRFAGVDADGDGTKNPQDMADAAAATAAYLCSGPGDVRVPDQLRSAILRYNASDSYVRTVTSIAEAYREGVTALPAAALPAANPARSTSGPTKQVIRPASLTPGRTTPGKSGPAATPSRARPAVNTGAPATIPPITSVVETTPSAPDPAVSTPVLPDPPVVPDPAVTGANPLIPCLPVPTVTTTVLPVPTETAAVPFVPCLSAPAVTDLVAPIPCVPDPTVTTTVLPAPTETITAATLPCLLDRQ